MKNKTKNSTKFVGATAVALAAASGTIVSADTTDNPLQTPDQAVQVVDQKAEVKEPQNLAEAKTQLAETEVSYQKATEAHNQAQANLDKAQGENHAAVRAETENEEALKKVETEHTPKQDELKQTEAEIPVVTKEATTAEKAYAEETAKNPNAEKELEKASSSYNTVVAQEKEVDQKVEDLAKQTETAQNKTAELTASVQKAESEVNGLSDQLTDLKDVVKKAEAQVQSAEKKVTEKQNQVDDEVAKLQKAVDTAPTDDIVTYEKTNLYALNGSEVEKSTRKKAKGQTTAAAKRVNEKEEMLFAGKAEEKIDLTDKQQEQYETSGVISYTPDAKKITQYMVDYINKLREINGIADKVTYDDVAQQIAQKRADEMLANNRLEHKAGVKDYSWENIAKVTYGKDTSYYFKDHIVLSDKEMAYRQLSGWFAEYNNIVSGSGNYMYGHRLALLFGKTGLGFGLSASTADADADANEFNSYASMNITTPKGEFSRSSMSGAVTYVKEGDQLVMYLNGRRVQFLPDTTFNYISNKKIVTPNPAKGIAQAKLDAYKKQAEQELASLRQNVSYLRTQSNDFAGEYNVVSNKLAIATNKLDAVRRDLKSSQADVTRLKQAFATAVAEQAAVRNAKTQAEKELARVKTANQSLAKAKDAYNTAREKLVGLQKKAETLQKDVANLSKSRDELLRESKAIGKRLNDSIVAVTEAKRAYNKTKVALSEATERYMKAQADVLKFTPQPANPSPKPDDKVTPSVPALTDKGQVADTAKDKTKETVKPADKGQSVDKGQPADNRQSVDKGQTTLVKPTEKGQDVTTTVTTKDTVVEKSQEKVVVPLVTNHAEGQSDVKSQSDAKEPVKPAVYGGTQKVLPSTGDATSNLATFGLTLLGGLGLGVVARRKKN